MGMLLSIIKASNQYVYDKESVGFKIGNSCNCLALALFFFQMVSTFKPTTNESISELPPLVFIKIVLSLIDFK